MTPLRMRAVDFGRAVKRNAKVLLLRTPGTGPAWNAYVAVLSTASWGALMATLIFLAAVFFLHFRGREALNFQLRFLEVDLCRGVRV